MVKIYRGDFRKDYLGLTLVIGSLGALLIIMPLVVFYLWIGNEVNSGISLSDIALNAGFFLVLFLAGSCACFYLIWRGVNERVIVGDGALTYYATFSSRKIPALDVEKVMIFDREQPIVIYDSGDDLKRLKLPRWKSNDYIDGLVADMKRMNPGIEMVDLRKDADVEVRYEEAAQ